MLSCLQRTIERWRQDGKGHRISGDTPGSLFFNIGDFVEEELGGLP